MGELFSGCHMKTTLKSEKTKDAPKLGRPLKTV
jgi:hypothetical protein